MKFSNRSGYYPPSRGALGGAVVRSVRGAQHMKRYHVPKKQLSTQFSISNQATLWAQYIQATWLALPAGDSNFYDLFCAVFDFEQSEGDGYEGASSEGLTRLTKACAAYLTLGLTPDPIPATLPPYGDGTIAPRFMNQNFYFYFSGDSALWPGSFGNQGPTATYINGLYALAGDGVTPLQIILYAAAPRPPGFIWVENYPATPNPPEGPLVGPLINNNAPECQIIFTGVPPGPGVLTWDIRPYYEAVFGAGSAPVVPYSAPTVYLSGYFVDPTMGMSTGYPTTSPVSYDTFQCGILPGYQANLIFDNTTIQQYFGRNSSQKLAANIVAGTYPVPLRGSADRAAWAGRSTARAAAMAGRGGIWPGAPPHVR